MSKITLRYITDALAADDPGFDDPKEARTKYYDRGRMLRDRGLIRSSIETQQGRTTEFTEADAVAAAVLICANRDGTPWSILEAIHASLRTFGNTTGIPAFETNLERIKASAATNIRVYVVRKPFPGVHVEMGDPGDLPLGREVGAAKSEDYPVDQLAAPVLKALGEK